MGQALAWSHIAEPRGHAIECRLYAEDPYQGGIPSVGQLGYIYFPDGPFRRFDAGFAPGDIITEYYDSMIGKIIVWDETRVRAIQKMRRVLSEMVVFGVRTNVPLLKKILQHPDFIDGVMTTRFFESHFSQPLEKQDTDPRFVEELNRRIAAVPGSPTEGQNPWFHAWSE
jgi:3-methylcrotonyl-CoA carboxylase alpha subunit